MTLGPYPATTLEQARELAREALHAALRGDDPRDSRRQKKEAARHTFKAVMAEYIERRVRREQQLRTADEIEARIKNHVLKAWGKRPIAEITRRDVRERLETLVDEGMGAGANRVLSHLSALFKWAAERDYIIVPPTFGVRAPIPEKRRDRVLSDDEIRALWTAADTLGTYGRLVQLLLATAQRRTVTAAMRWDQLDLKAATWTVPGEPGSKSDHAWIVPLNATALAILKRCRVVDGSPYVLASRVKRTYFTGFTSGQKKLDALLKDVPHWTRHDLRRTAASNMTAAGVPRLIVERVLDHADNSLAGTYDRHDYLAEKRDALARWSDRLQTIVRRKK
jgi:integrase